MAEARDPERRPDIKSLEMLSRTMAACKAISTDRRVVLHGGRAIRDGEVITGVRSRVRARDWWLALFHQERNRFLFFRAGPTANSVRIRFLRAYRDAVERGGL